MTQGLGSGDNGSFTFLDLISILSFVIALQNLDLNVTQEDAQNLQRDLAEKSDLLLKEIHGHLEQQDDKINKIISMLEVNK